MTAALGVADLGRRAYGEVLEIQRDLCRRRVALRGSQDLLLLVEHDPVYTLGRGTRATSLPVSPAELEQGGAEVFEVERGGDVTYHGPGQLVGYPIIDLTQQRQDLHWYMRELEGALVDALAVLGIAAGRNPGLTGVWTAGRKIASIGIHVKQWVTMHGFALNVTTDLAAFGRIVPCGIDQVEMTSVAAELPGRDAALLRDSARAAVVAAFAARFDRVPVDVDAGSLVADEAGIRP